MSLPPVAPEVTAAAVESLTSRLLKKLDAAVGQYGAAEAVADGDVVRVRCGEDAVVTLAPDASGVVALDEQATCTCLLAPKCLHRAAVLTACPVADSQGATALPAEAHAAADADSMQVAEATKVSDVVEATEAAQPVGPGDVQVAAAAALWSAAASILAAGIPAAGAVPQAELLRAAHTARLAGLHRPEAAALRVVRNLRAARSQSDAHRLGDLVADLSELLLTASLLAAADPDPDLVGTARRAYEPGGSLRVHGVCREPVLSATGYGGVVTHVLAEDGHWFTVSDVKPGGAARARGAATAPVAIGASALDHNQLSRGGLLIAGATVSADGRLGAGKGVRATPLTGQGWSGGPLSALFAKPLGAAVRAQLTGVLGAGSDTERQGSDLIGCDVVVVGASGDSLLVRAVDGGGGDGQPGPLIRLVAAHGHPDFAHTENLRRLAAHPGLRIRVVGRLDPDRTATLRPLAVGPVPDAEATLATLRLPESWQGHADLGYDRLQGVHFPPSAGDGPGPGPGPGSGPAVAEPPDLVADSPLWRLRHIVELAVSGGRRTVAEFSRTSAPHVAHLRRSGLHAAADRVAALAAEADRRDRDVFGRLTDPDPGRYAQAWLAAGLQLAATERALVRASWEHSG
ncbi:SWIM zinc finger family protein [Catenulispora rubra]|uniref:SWIM zinc finger family protein n=1 Tax=Catenulispora rubra TaxID=280293 RepID=UPI00189213C8|nr:SWIM zinc finger family protein [Catenulispora rubra]